MHSLVGEPTSAANGRAEEGALAAVTQTSGIQVGFQANLAKESFPLVRNEIDRTRLCHLDEQPGHATAK